MVLISFREWLHSYEELQKLAVYCEHDVLISFREWLHSYTRNVSAVVRSIATAFSSLSESGFIPTIQGALYK